MSFDLIVFDPKAAPKGKADFIKWVDELTEWDLEDDDDSPENLSGNLGLFLEKIQRKFPGFDKIDEYEAAALASVSHRPSGFWRKLFTGGQSSTPSEPEFDESYFTEYCHAENLLVLSFRWSVAQEAYDRVLSVARSTGVGFYDTSVEDGKILYNRKQLSEHMGVQHPE